MTVIYGASLNNLHSGTSSYMLFCKHVPCFLNLYFKLQFALLFCVILGSAAASMYIVVFTVKKILPS